MGRRRQNDLHWLDLYRCAPELYQDVGRMIAQFPRREHRRSQMRRACPPFPRRAERPQPAVGVDRGP